MRKHVFTLLLSFILIQASGQYSRKVSTYLSGQYTATIKDYTKINNPEGFGVSLQAFLNTESKFKPTLEVTGDLFLGGKKIYYMWDDGTPVETLDGVINVFAGASYHPANRIFTSLMAGPSFLNGHTLLSIKPSVGVYLSKTKRALAKLSYIHTLNREPVTKTDFSGVSFSIGFRLF